MKKKLTTNKTKKEVKLTLSKKAMRVVIMFVMTYPLAKPTVMLSSCFLVFHRKYNCHWCEKTGRYNVSCTGCTFLRPLEQMLCADSHTTVPLILGSRTVCCNCEDDELRAGDPVRYCREC